MDRIFRWLKSEGDVSSTSEILRKNGVEIFGLAGHGVKYPADLEEIVGAVNLEAIATLEVDPEKFGLPEGKSPRIFARSGSRYVLSFQLEHEPVFAVPKAKLEDFDPNKFTWTKAVKNRTRR